MIKANDNSIIPLKTAAELVRLPCTIRGGLAELRLRAGRRAVAVTTDRRHIPCSETLGAEDIRRCFDELCGSSLHSFSREIREGYITLDGGHRVGFCGAAVTEGGDLSTLKCVGSINIRIARQVRGCGEELYRRLYADGLKNVLLIGAPMSGKTTLLRDLTRLLGEGHTVSLIDSRCEIAACSGGVPQLDVGENTDVLSGYPRLEGMTVALRSLSPEVLVCDELLGETAAVERCARSGVRLLATVHSGSVEELRCSQMGRLLRYFDMAVVLGEIGSASEVVDLREAVCV